MAEGNGARSAHSRLRWSNLAERSHARNTGSHRRYRAVNRRCTSPWALSGDNLYGVDGQASNRYTSIRNKMKVFPTASSAGGAGCAVLPSRCHLLVQHVPGWCGLGFPLGLWAALRRIAGERAWGEEAGEGGIPPWWSDMCGLSR